jgi:hypothetical protein
MNGTSGFQEVRSSPPDHLRIGSCTSNGLNSEQVTGILSVLTIAVPTPVSTKLEEVPHTIFSTLCLWGTCEKD